ncbi:MAG: hypothetical protein HOG20_07545 [Candidatus Marinimicrobia bacterium]|jgi:tetratricopeptide (TPR) repeat protein|nr:hypothetical protein [Candidatus Neomarinimicrobiota bacterium]MBT3693056.1 hypothetical protein [Candidatus Neomarinimicrobiota bacterium]MBT3732770.1 hypothetical protein [Candidatus Neomarinimicrobiota bacterium]MBT4593331.1 hypothetical protein [Candidatus Neomarinimicrobiota bacterium]MBT4990884.1 hypothetical protein [Candidatus Neomarinimicrobiota bacterium]
MNKFILTLFFFSALFGESIDAIYQSAHQSMNAESYQVAANQYESILAQGFESGALYYNLGNAYFRQHLFGHAIWAYEKSLQFSPRNEDGRYNLDLANARIVDKIDMPDSGFLLSFYRTIKYAFTLNEMIFIAGILLCLSVFVFALKRLFGLGLNIIKKIAYGLIFFSLVLHLITFDQYWTKMNESQGILIDNHVSVFSGPFQKNDAILFRVNEGTKVEILVWENQWVEIILIDGKKGWIPAETLRKL